MKRQMTRAIALAFVASMVLTLVAPAAAGAGTTDGLAVTTDGATDVTETTATLQGNLTDLGNATEANVSFTYWVDGDAENASTVDAGVTNETGAFEATASGLEANTTYVVVAEATASGAVATGENATFTTDDPFDVRTLEPADVTNTSATLRGELVDLDGAENATVWFEYRPADDANATRAGARTLNETAAFETTVTGLDENATYVYAAHAQPADGEVEAGEEVTIEAATDDEPAAEPFGQRVSAYVHSILETAIDGPRGQLVSEWVVANNPGADNRPDHAGPDGEGGPPDHAKGDAGDADGTEGNDATGEEDGAAEREGTETEEDAEGDDTGAGDDRDRGPPDHANDDEDRDDAEDDDSDRRGNGKGNGKAKGHARR